MMEAEAAPADASNIRHKATSSCDAIALSLTLRLVILAERHGLAVPAQDRPAVAGIGHPQLIAFHYSHHRCASGLQSPRRCFSISHPIGFMPRTTARHARICLTRPAYAHNSHTWCDAHVTQWPRICGNPETNTSAHIHQLLNRCLAEQPRASPYATAFHADIAWQTEEAARG